MAENKSKSGSRGSSLKRLLHRSSTGKRNVINREKSIESNKDFSLLSEREELFSSSSASDYSGTGTAAAAAASCAAVGPANRSSLNASLGSGGSAASASDEPDGGCHSSLSHPAVFDPVSCGDQEIEQAWGETLLNPEKTRKACMVALQCTRDYGGAPVVIQDMERYIRKVFNSIGLFDSTLEELSDSVDQYDPPELKLIVTVVSAEAIEPKSYTMKSRFSPYCRLGVLHQQHKSRESDPSNLSDWEKEGGIVKKLVTTKTKQGKDPVWDETFELPIDSANQDILVVEVWDGGNKRISGAIHGGTDVGVFLGRRFVRIEMIPAEGKELGVKLASHSVKHERGKVNLWVALRGKKNVRPLEIVFEERDILFKSLLLFESKQDGQQKCVWDAQLSPLSVRLLAQHSALYNINRLQEIALQLSGLVKYHKIYYGVEMGVFINLLDEALDNEAFFPENNVSDGTMDTKEAFWVSKLFDGLQELVVDIESLLKNHLLTNQFDRSSREGMESLRMHLKFLKTLDNYEPFVNRPKSRNNKSCRQILEDSVQPAVEQWFTITQGNVQSHKSSKKLKSLKKLCQECKEMCLQVYRTIVPVYKRQDVDYFTHFIVAMDAQLAKEVQSTLEIYQNATEKEALRITFSIYQILNQLSEYADMTRATKEELVCLKNFHRLFAPLVEQWIKLSAQECKNRIEKAIAIDKVKKVANEAKLSSSCVDTKNFLWQMVAFWDHLKWPVSLESYHFLTILTEYIYDCASHYVETVNNRLKQGDMFGSDGEFHASEQLCLILNDMTNIKVELELIKNSQELDLDGFRRQLMELSITSRENAQSSLEKALRETAERIQKIIRDIAKELIPRFRTFIVEMIEVEEGVQNDELSLPLIEYMTEKLTPLKTYLLDEAFMEILSAVWVVTLNTLNESSFLVISKRNKRSSVYLRLHECLLHLKQFFNAGGNGLCDDDLDTAEFTTLQEKLYWSSIPTDELTLKCCADLTDQQQKARESSASEALDYQRYGTMQISVGYIIDHSCVEVTVIAAKGLTPVRKGKISPYVKLCLIPKNLFSRSAERKYKTKIHKNSADPSFYQEFLLPAEEEDLNQYGSALLMVTTDRSSRCVVGINVVSCTEIPRLYSDTPIDEGSPSRLRLELPLISMDIRDAPAFKELMSRQIDARDRLAVDFLKFLRHYMPYSGLTLSPKRNGTVPSATPY